MVGTVGRWPIGMLLTRLRMYNGNLGHSSSCITRGASDKTPQRTNTGPAQPHKHTPGMFDTEKPGSRRRLGDVLFLLEAAAIQQLSTWAHTNHSNAVCCGGYAYSATVPGTAKEEARDLKGGTSHPHEIPRTDSAD